MSPARYTIPRLRTVVYIDWALAAVTGQITLAVLHFACRSLPAQHPTRIFMNEKAPVLSRSLIHELPTWALLIARVIVFSCLLFIAYEIMFGAAVARWLFQGYRDPILHNVRG